jgi:hypothetical protein
MTSDTNHLFTKISMTAILTFFFLLPMRLTINED